MTLTRAVIRFAVVAAPSLIVAAAPLRIVIDPAHAEACRSGVVVVTPICAAAPCERESTATWRFDTDGRAVVNLDAAAAERWNVTVRAERCWAPTVRAGPEDSGREIALRVWRSAEVSGRLKFPEEAKSQRSVAVRVESTPEPNGKATVPATDVQCPIAGGRFRCTVPAAALDLRIAPDGWAPQYVWNVQPRADATVDVGELKFDRGGTITGFVRIAGDGPALPAVAIEVVPALPPPTTGYAEGERRISARAERVRPNARGFFEVRQLNPGPYSITARVDGWSPARDPDVRVEDARETHLANPLVIEPLARVEVFLMPPLDPSGEPWRVSLQQMAPQAGNRVTVAEGAASLTGQWSVEGAHAALHLVQVSDHRGNHFAREVVQVSPRMPPLQLAITAVGIEGIVRLGDVPLQTRLEFRRNGHVVFRSDEQGRFSGVLPEEGRWNVGVTVQPKYTVTRTIEVRRGDGGAAHIDLELPDTSIDVKVVSETGKPVRAQVHAVDRTGRPLAIAPTDEEGHAQLVGLDADQELRLSASASSQNMESGVVPVTFDEDGHAEVTMVMRSRIRVRAWLVSPSGRPVAGAYIRWMAPHGTYSREQVTGPSGDVEIILPHDAGNLDMVILPPAMPVKILSIPVDPAMDPNVEIVVGGPSATLELTMSHSSPPFPFIRRNGRALEARMLLYPPNWMTAPTDRRPWGVVLTLEAGSYAVCSNTGAICKQVNLLPGAVERVDGRALLQ